MLDMKKKVMGHSYMDWAWVIGGGVVVGSLAKMVGFKGLGLAVIGSITGYCIRGWKTNGAPKITDLRQMAMEKARAMAQLTNGNGNGNGVVPQPIPITGASADNFIVPDPSAAPAPGSEGALAGYGARSIDPNFQRFQQRSLYPYRA